MSAMLSAVVLPLLLALPGREPPGSLEIKLAASSASGATYPLAAATASPASGYTLIGGGCAASFVGDDAPPSFIHALILHTSKPSSGSWQCAAGVPPNLYPGAGRVVAAGIYAQASATQGKVHLDCVVREATSPRGPAPSVDVQLSSADLDNHYVLTSGSCTGEDASQGPYNTVIFSSRPHDDMKGWSCEASGPYSATDPEALNMATTVTAHLVACRLQGPGVLESKLFTGPVHAEEGDIGNYPSSQAEVEPGYALTGGGCVVIATQPLPDVGTPAPRVHGPEQSCVPVDLADSRPQRHLGLQGRGCAGRAKSGHRSGVRHRAARRGQGGAVDRHPRSGRCETAPVPWTPEMW